MRILLSFCHVSSVSCVPVPPLPSLALPLCAHPTGLLELHLVCLVVGASPIPARARSHFYATVWSKLDGSCPLVAAGACAQQLELQGTSGQAKGQRASSEPEEPQDEKLLFSLAVASALPWAGCSSEDAGTLCALPCSPAWWCLFSPAKPH